MEMPTTRAREPAARSLELPRLVSQVRVELAGPAVANTPVKNVGGNHPDAWVFPDSDYGVKVVEGPVSVFCPRPDGVGALTVTVEPGVEVLVGPDEPVWTVGLAGNVERELAARAEHAGVLQARLEAARSAEPAGWYSAGKREKVLSIRLAGKCPHDSSKWEGKACGHAKCELCDGYVHPFTRVALPGPGPVIRCNRRHHALDDYEYRFGENQAGSHVLTDAMK